MSQMIAIYDCASIQRYLFGSPRLAESVGASLLVERALGEWLPEQLKTSADAWRSPTATWMFEPAVPEILYIGGGNAVVRYPERAALDRHTLAWSIRVLEQAAGLQAYVGLAEYIPGNLHEAMTQAFNNLRRRKDNALVTQAIECLPVTRRCASTGMAATTLEALDREWISQGSQIKRSAADAADARLQQIYTPARRKYTRQIGHLTVTGESGQIAIGHIDGNDMGKLMTSHQAGNDGELVAAMRRTSMAITDASTRVLKDSLAWLDDRTSPSSAGADSEARTWAQGETFPVRPVIFGGDDFTFVASGPVGLGFAAKYLELWSGEQINGQQLTAAAGVAIVPAHFPFTRAYELADDLCKEAKVKARDIGGSWLDFEILTGGSLGSLNQIRGPYSKPWQVTPIVGGGWSDLEEACRVFVSGSDGQGWPRWRVHQLLEEAERGTANALAEDWKAAQLPLPVLFTRDASRLPEAARAFEYLPADLHISLRNGAATS